MIISSQGKKPNIHKDAYVAPTATISGDVTIEEGCAVLFGAVITAEGAPVVVGANTVVMENAVVKGSGGTAMQFPCSIGESCIVGPGAYVVGATIEPGVLISSGARVYNGTVVTQGSTVEAPGGAAHGTAEFLQEVFNVPDSPNARAKAAETYAKFLRKTHAQDAGLGTSDKKPALKGPPRKTAEEPPPTLATEVEKVVDVMFVEIEEARLRREAAIEREKRGGKK